MEAFMSRKPRLGTTIYIYIYIYICTYVYIYIYLSLKTSFVFNLWNGPTLLGNRKLTEGIVTRYAQRSAVRICNSGDGELAMPESPCEGGERRPKYGNGGFCFSLHSKLILEICWRVPAHFLRVAMRFLTWSLALRGAAKRDRGRSDDAEKQNTSKRLQGGDVSSPASKSLRPLNIRPTLI